VRVVGLRTHLFVESLLFSGSAAAQRKSNCEKKSINPSTIFEISRCNAGKVEVGDIAIQTGTAERRGQAQQDVMEGGEPKKTIGIRQRDAAGRSRFLL